ncbi:unnamed protein product [Rotaria sordida]|uniref:Uncharacterized protein n=1 Tax=Rotaria sordida TaxID=392033 RepID=A0A815D8B8_9BILA|nr:unnamed protein product [Rotaria sordida]CAF3788309.1 unnamed protein product [Rotaria sordida]
MASLTNVNIGKSLCRDELSTTGVFTCIVVVGHFFNNTTFIHHMSSNDFDLEAIDLAYEGQKMIENSIRHINKSNAKVVSLCDIFIVGGVDTDQFLKLENALHSIKTNFINMTPIDSKVSSVDLQTFLERIKYINITINYADNSIDYENIDDDHRST